MKKSDSKYKLLGIMISCLFMNISSHSDHLMITDVQSTSNKTQKNCAFKADMKITNSKQEESDKMIASNKHQKINAIKIKNNGSKADLITSQLKEKANALQSILLNIHQKIEQHDYQKKIYALLNTLHSINSNNNDILISQWNDLAKNTRQDSQKDTSFESFNEILPTTSNVNEILSYIKNFDKEIQTLQSIVKDIENLQGLLNNPQNEQMIKSLNKLSHHIDALSVNTSLTNETNLILKASPIIFDLLTYLLISKLKTEQTQRDKNRKSFIPWSSNFAGKKKISAFNIINLLSLTNDLTFSNLKVTETSLDNHSNSFSTWLMKKRASYLIKTLPHSEKNAYLSSLKLQQSVLLKLIQVFAHNYSDKKIMTKKDSDHLIKLLHKINLISFMINEIEPSANGDHFSSKDIQHLKFNANSIIQGMKYAKNNNYTPDNIFWKNKKKIELKAINFITRETSPIGINYLSDQLLKYFQYINDLTHQNQINETIFEGHDPILIKKIIKPKKF